MHEQNFSKSQNGSKTMNYANKNRNRNKFTGRYVGNVGRKVCTNFYQCRLIITCINEHLKQLVTLFWQNCPSRNVAELSKCPKSVKNRNFNKNKKTSLGNDDRNACTKFH